MNYEKVTEDVFKLETDEYGAPKFTQGNFKLINTFLKYDSNYNSAEDSQVFLFAKTYGGILSKLKQEFFNFKTIEDYGSEEEYMKKDPLYIVIESIDKMNSTHLASQGQKGGNRGRIETAKGVYNLENFKERLFLADTKLVNDIAKFGGKNNFSFASKFCAYLCRYIYKGEEQENNYCIYDEVVQSVLPYFAYKYGVEEWQQTYASSVREGKVHNRSVVWKIKDSKEDENSYAKYIGLIKTIIEKIKEESKIDVTFEAFDHMLWYFFKGQEYKREELLGKLPNKKKVPNTRDEAKAQMRYFCTAKGTTIVGKMSNEELSKIL